MKAKLKFKADRYPTEKGLSSWGIGPIIDGKWQPSICGLTPKEAKDLVDSLNKK